MLAGFVKRFAIGTQLFDFRHLASDSLAAGSAASIAFICFGQLLAKAGPATNARAAATIMVRIFKSFSFFVGWIAIGYWCESCECPDCAY